MNMRKSRTLSTIQGVRNKLVLGFIGAITVAVVGSAGVAAAQSMNDNNMDHNSGDMHGIVAFCKDKYKDLGFKNVGQCVSFFVHHKGHGYGYGGNGHHHHHHHHHNGFFGWWFWMQDHAPGQDN